MAALASNRDNAGGVDCDSPSWPIVPSLPASFDLKAVSEQLVQKGYAVLDSFLPEEQASAVAEEAWSWQKDRDAFLFTPTEQSPSIRTDVCIDWDPLKMNSAISYLCRQMQFSCCASLRSVFGNENLLPRERPQFAFYDKQKNFYVRHVDNPRCIGGDDNLRKITMVYYPNPGLWRSSDGGNLRLHLNTEIDIEPAYNRLVVFFSDVVEHEVLPSNRERLALTVWLSDVKSGFSEDSKIALVRKLFQLMT